MTRSFPHLGYDPTPGDVERTRSLARQLGDLYGELTTTIGELDRIECGYWKGEAAKAFVAHIDSDVTPLIKKAHDSFGRASGALSRWADQLYGFQSEADALEQEAVTKQVAVDHAKTAAGLPTDNTVPHPAPEASPDPSAAADAKKKLQALTEANNALQGVLHRAEELHTRYTNAAHSISHDLDKAGDIAPDKPGLFSRIVHGVEDAWNDTVQWVKDHADLIKLIGDLLSDLTGILAILAIITAPFEPLGAIFAGAALVTGALALGAHALAKLAGADVSWMQLGLDVLGVLPGIGLFGKGATVAKEAASVERAAETAAQFGKGFKATVAESKNIISFGEKAADVTGGLRFKNIALFGTKDVGLVIKPGSALASKLANVSNNAYHQGQWIGTKGIKLVTFGKYAINPLGKVGQTIDVAAKALPKAFSIPQHIGEAVHLGDRFHQAATAK
jgi:hypothetical protein